MNKDVKTLQEKGWQFEDHSAHKPFAGGYLVIPFEKGMKLKECVSLVLAAEAQLELIMKTLTLYQTLKETLS